MNVQEAASVLEQELENWRRESYAELVRRIDHGAQVSERAGGAAAKYQLEIECLWDGPRGGNVRVVGSIDDGGLRALAPLTRSFLKSPDGAFVGE